jgi:hypothetical protein
MPTFDPLEGIDVACTCEAGYVMNNDYTLTAYPLINFMKLLE